MVGVVRHTRFRSFIEDLSDQIGRSLVSFLRNQLFGVTAFDIPTYAIAMVVIALAAFTASWAPARRASQSNPLAKRRERV